MPGTDKARAASVSVCAWTRTAITAVAVSNAPCVLLSFEEGGPGLCIVGKWPFKMSSQALIACRGRRKGRPFASIHHWVHYHGNGDAIWQWGVQTEILGHFACEQHGYNAKTEISYGQRNGVVAAAGIRVHHVERFVNRKKIHLLAKKRRKFDDNL